MATRTPSSIRERPSAADRAVEIVDESGAVLGRRQGLHRFTVGQRRGLGVTAADKLYVLDVKAEQGQITVGPADGLYSSGLLAVRCNWLAIDAPASPVRAEARIRHRHEEASATLTPMPDGSIAVEFDTNQRAITPGQGVAFYRDGLLLGGGWIARAEAARA